MTTSCVEELLRLWDRCPECQPPGFGVVGVYWFLSDCDAIAASSCEMGPEYGEAIASAWIERWIPRKLVLYITENRYGGWFVAADKRSIGEYRGHRGPPTKLEALVAFAHSVLDEREREPEPDKPQPMSNLDKLAKVVEFVKRIAATETAIGAGSAMVNAARDLLKEIETS